MSKKLNLYEAGFSLVETLVAIALATIVALGASYLITDTAKNQLNAENMAYSLGFMMLIRQSISSGDAHCKKTLASTVFPAIITTGSGLPLKLNIAGKPVEAGVTNVFGGASTDPNRIELNSVSLNGIVVTTTAGGGKNLIGNLEISATRFENNTGFAKIYKVGGLMVNLDSTNVITTCSGLTDNNLEETCVSIGAVWNTLDQVCRIKSPACPAGSMVILKAGVPDCLDFKVYLASLCAPGYSLKSDALGKGITCAL